jgi:hypothetical protein
MAGQNSAGPPPELPSAQTLEIQRGLAPARENATPGTPSPSSEMMLTQTLKVSGSIVGLVDGFSQATQNIERGFCGALSDNARKAD